MIGNAPPRVCVPCSLFRRLLGGGWRWLRWPAGGVGGVVMLALMAPSSLPPPKSSAAAAPAAVASAAPASAGAAAGPAAALGAAITKTVANAVAQALADMTQAIDKAAAPSSASASAATASAVTAAGSAATSAATGTAAAAASAAAAADAAAQAASAAAGAANTAASAAVAAASAATHAPAAPPVRFTTRSLPSAQLGRPWGPITIVTQGSLPVVVSFANPPGPAWITRYADGQLAGTPDQPGTFRFSLRAAPADAPARYVEQAFELRVVKPASGAAPSKPPKPIKVDLSAEQATATPASASPEPASYRLEAEDIQALQAMPAAASDPTDSGAPAAPAARPPGWRLEFAGDTALPDPPQALGPTPDQLGFILVPLQGVDYPSRAQFLATLNLSVCTEFKLLAAAGGIAADVVQAEMLRAGVDVAQGCAATGTAAMPVRPLQTGDPVPARTPLPLLFQKLMPASLQDAIVSRAMRTHPQDQPAATTWAATQDCGCSPEPRAPADISGSDVVLFAPYWGSTAQQQAAAAAASAAAAEPVAEPASAPAAVTRAVDFGFYNRISYLGALLNDAGEIDFPGEVRRQGEDLARQARRYNAAIDLVLYRGRWGASPPTCNSAKTWPVAGTEDFCAKAVRNALALIDGPVADPDGPQAWIQRPMGVRIPRAWDGLTLFFDNAPPHVAGGADAYAGFFASFVGDLLAAMQKSGRAYHLNIVLPAAEMSEAGRYRFADLVSLIHRAEPPSKPGLGGNFLWRGYEGTTPITVHYMLLLGAPGADAQKALRARLDKSANVRGEDRVSLLRSLLPVLTRPEAIQPPWSAQTPIKQFNDDVTYTGWNFGGVTMWQLPEGKADRELSDALIATYRTAAVPPWAGLASWVCRWRLWLNLALALLVPLTAILFLVWRASCALQRVKPATRSGFLAGVVAVGIVTAALFLLLLAFDPRWDAVSGNKTTILCVLVGILAVLYNAFKPKDDVP